MTDLSRKIFDHYQIRKTRKQKDAFLHLMQRHFPEATVQKGGFPQCRNLIIGDVESAKVVLTAHYDTCAQLLLPNFILPKRPLLSLLYGFVIAIPLLLIVFLLSFLMGILQLPRELAQAIGYLSYFIMLILLFAGPANKHNANDNTSGVITLCELLECLTKEQRQKVAFVFFDHEESGLIGSSYFRNQFKAIMKKKLLINFDCVSDGDTILLAVSKAARKEWGKLIDQAFLPSDNKTVLLAKAEKIYYPSDQLGFHQTVAAAALKHKKYIGYYMNRIHTNKDTQFDKENIKLLCDGILRLLQKI